MERAKGRTARVTTCRENGMFTLSGCCCGGVCIPSTSVAALNVVREETALVARDKKTLLQAVLT